MFVSLSLCAAAARAQSQPMPPPAATLGPIGPGAPGLVPVASPTSTPASPVAVNATADEQARQLFLEGRNAFSEGRFEDAARAFERAHELSQRHQLLYNVGTAYERLHNWPRAREAFQGYLDQVPDAPDRQEVRSRLDVIDVEIQHQTPVQNTRVVVIETPSVTPDPPRPWRTVFWVGAGLTAVSGLATITIYLLARSLYTDLAGSCGRTAMGCGDATINDIQLRAGLTNGGIALTSLLAAGTVTAFILDASRPRPASRTTHVPTAMLLPVPGGLMFSLGGAL